MFDTRSKNQIAIQKLIKEIARDSSLKCEDIRLHCRAIVYTCFLMEIEPYQMPLSQDSSGNLSECQKKNFLHQYVSLYLNCRGEQYQRITIILDKTPAWSYLLELSNEIIDKLFRSRE